MHSRSITAMARDIPIEEDLTHFLQTTGAEWQNIMLLPWSTGSTGNTFFAIRSSEAGGLGQPFNAKVHGSAAVTLNSLKKSHIPVLLNVEEVQQEFLFFHRKKSK